MRKSGCFFQDKGAGKFSCLFLMLCLTGALFLGGCGGEDKIESGSGRRAQMEEEGNRLRQSRASERSAQSEAAETGAEPSAGSGGMRREGQETVEAVFAHAPFTVSVPEGFQIREAGDGLELELENTAAGCHIFFIADASAEFAMSLEEYAGWTWEDLENKGNGPAPLALPAWEGALLAYYIREDFMVEGEPYVSHWYLFEAGDYYVVCAETVGISEDGAAREEMETLLKGLRMLP